MIFKPNLEYGDSSVGYDFARVYRSNVYIDVYNSLTLDSDDYMLLTQSLATNSSPISNTEDKLIFISSINGAIGSRLYIPSSYTDVERIEFRQTIGNKIIIFSREYDEEFYNWISSASTSYYRSIGISGGISDISSNTPELNIHVQNFEDTATISSDDLAHFRTLKGLLKFKGISPSYAHLNQLRFGLERSSDYFMYVDTVNTLAKPPETLEYVYGNYYIRPDFVKSFLGFEVEVSQFSTNSELYVFDSNRTPVIGSLVIDLANLESKAYQFDLVGRYNSVNENVCRCYIDTPTSALSIDVNGNLIYDKSKLGALASNQVTVSILDGSNDLLLSKTFTIYNSDLSSVLDKVLVDTIYYANEGYYDLKDFTKTGDYNIYNYLDITASMTYSNITRSVSIDRSLDRLYLSLPANVESATITVAFQGSTGESATKTIAVESFDPDAFVIPEGTATLVAKDSTGQSKIAFTKTTEDGVQVIQATVGATTYTVIGALDFPIENDVTYLGYGLVVKTLYISRECITSLPKIYKTVELRSTDLDGSSRYLVYALDPKKFGTYYADNKYTYDSISLDESGVASFNEETRDNATDYLENIPYSQNFYIYAKRDSFMYSKYVVIER